MDVLNKYLPVENRDDIAYSTVVMLSLSYLAFESVTMILILVTLSIITHLCYINRVYLLEFYNKRRKPLNNGLIETEAVREEPREEGVIETESVEEADSIGKGRIELAKYVHIVDGEREYTDIPIYISLEDLGHVFIMGMTGYGKTTMLYWLISQIMTVYTPHEVQFGFADAKGVSLNIYNGTKHNFTTVATTKEEISAMIDLAYLEMEKRRDMFKLYANSRLCASKEQYEKITGEKLPYLLFVFDELADAVDKGSDEEKKLISLAKMARSTGIRLIMATQRPTVDGISHEVQTQCQTVICFHMKSNREYGTIAQTPSTVYKYMTAKPGLAIIQSPKLSPEFIKRRVDSEGWGIIQGNYMTEGEIEQVANGDKGTPPLFQELPIVEVELTWGGTSDDKFQAMALLEEKLNRDLEVDDMITTFGITRKTATTWLEKFNG